MRRYGTRVCGGIGADLRRNGPALCGGMGPHTLYTYKVPLITNNRPVTGNRHFQPDGSMGLLWMKEEGRMGPASSLKSLC
jgi:hypothetical protein